MLFNDRLLFVHVPKTAGDSVTKFLIDNLPGRKTLVEGSNKPDPSVRLPPVVIAKLHTKAFLKRWGLWLPASVATMEGERHARLHEIREIFAKLGRSLDDLRAIIVCVRNPYDLEVSRYHFLRLGYHGVRGVARGREQKIAIEGSFEEFARTAPYHGRLPARIEAWYELGGRMPANLRIIRFENLETDLHRAVGEFCPTRTGLPRLNATVHEPYSSYLSPAAEEAIYNKYRWLFDRQFYERELATSSRCDVSL
ncbi:MAG TPA: sulfotransferase domain-containing protein [Rhizomicrobium sp.]|jgi:hypothetical protein|nr:sulfotransferase domain-containing protein [Rhizomicrobium sp.]